MDELEQVFRLKRILLRLAGRKRKLLPAKKPSWMTPVTHGYRVVQHHVIRDGSDSDLDSVVVQREQIDHTELWYFGIFDALIGDRVTKYMQSHLFGKKLQEVVDELFIYSLPLDFYTASIQVTVNFA